MEFSKYLKSFFISLTALGFSQLAYSYDYPEVTDFSFAKNPTIISIQ